MSEPVHRFLHGRSPDIEAWVKSLGVEPSTVSQIVLHIGHDAVVTADLTVYPTNLPGVDVNERWDADVRTKAGEILDWMIENRDVQSLVLYGDGGAEVARYRRRPATDEFDPTPLVPTELDVVDAPAYTTPFWSGVFAGAGSLAIIITGLHLIGVGA